MAAPRNSGMPPHFPHLLPPPPSSDSIGVSSCSNQTMENPQQNQQYEPFPDSSVLLQSIQEQQEQEWKKFEPWSDPYWNEDWSSPTVMSRADDCVDKNSGNVEEREEFTEDFRTYVHTDLNWCRLKDDTDESHVAGWVFWSRGDDRLNPLRVSDLENVDVFPDSIPKVKDKIRLALGRIILHPRYGQSLVQFWAASRTLEGRTLLSTRNQPFGLGKAGKSAWGLCEYRMKSMDYTFYGDIGEKGEEELGLPGRVFRYKLPESTPDVQYYSLKEYPQLHDASLCQVRASWALPVFEHSSQVCVGVLELVSAVDAIADWYDESFLHNLCDVFRLIVTSVCDLHLEVNCCYQ